MSASIEEQEREAAIEREERIASALERIGDVLEQKYTTEDPRATGIKITLEGTFMVTFASGAALNVPLEWFPTLGRARFQQLSNYQLIGGGVGIHWPDIDEDLSVSGIIARALGIEHKGD